jgi:hypothetical protein
MQMGHIIAFLAALFFIYQGAGSAFRTKRLIEHAKADNENSLLAKTFIGNLSRSLIESESYELSFKYLGFVAMLAGFILLGALFSGYLDR